MLWRAISTFGVNGRLLTAFWCQFSKHLKAHVWPPNRRWFCIWAYSHWYFTVFSMCKSHIPYLSMKQKFTIIIFWVALFEISCKSQKYYNFLCVFNDFMTRNFDLWNTDACWLFFWCQFSGHLEAHVWPPRDHLANHRRSKNSIKHNVVLSTYRFGEFKISVHNCQNCMSPFFTMFR